MDKPTPLVEQPSISLKLSPRGDISLNVSGAWPSALLFAAAGYITRLANASLDQQEAQGAMARNLLKDPNLRNRS